MLKVSYNIMNFNTFESTVFRINSNRIYILSCKFNDEYKISEGDMPVYRITKLDKWREIFLAACQKKNNRCPIYKNENWTVTFSRNSARISRHFVAEIRRPDNFRRKIDSNIYCTYFIKNPPLCRGYLPLIISNISLGASQKNSMQ